MMEPYSLLSKALAIIESKTSERLSIVELSKLLCLSSAHLQRLFKFAFGIPLASYIRSRKLSASALKLMTTDLNIIDIANECDFPYEQSYIRAFKKEYGITPGELRKSGTIIKVTPPLALFDKNKLPNGAIFGPEIVMVPGFHLIGRRHIVTFDESIELPPELAKTFWHEDKKKINDITEVEIWNECYAFKKYHTEKEVIFV